MTKIMNMIKEQAERRFALVINLFAESNTNVTTDTGLSDAMKTYYSDHLIDLAEPELIHDQFADKYPIPKNGGKTIEFRKYNPLGKALTPLVEGVTPAGQKLSLSVLTATIAQYGGYVETSDILQLTAIDPIIVQATEQIASQAGRTLDTITREVMVGGTNVMYAPNGETAITSRTAVTNACKLTPQVIRKAVMILKRQNAPKIDGSYVAIIHPDVAYDLMSDPEWIDIHKYEASVNIFNGEIGKLASVRFIENTEAKIFAQAGASGANVYATMVLGKGAYATTDVSGGGLRHIVKPLGSAGSADPLDQRATVGWKAIKTAERLIEQYMLRIESGASEGATAIAN